MSCCSGTANFEDFIEEPCGAPELKLSAGVRAGRGWSWRISDDPTTDCGDLVKARLGSAGQA